MSKRRARRPVTQADYDRVKELHAQEWSRNKIAKELDRSGKTISRIADELGLTFDRERTAAATAAKVADAKEKRAALALALLDDAERLRQQLWQPALVYNFGGKENVFASETIPEPDTRAKRDLMNAIGIAIDRSVKLDEYDADPGIDAAKSMLGTLAKGLGAAYDQLNQQTETSSDGD